jgi:hypothetical protein
MCNGRGGLDAAYISNEFMKSKLGGRRVRGEGGGRRGKGRGMHIVYAEKQGVIQ